GEDLTGEAGAVERRITDPAHPIGPAEVGERDLQQLIGVRDRLVRDRELGRAPALLAHRRVEGEREGQDDHGTETKIAPSSTATSKVSTRAAIPRQSPVVRSKVQPWSAQTSAPPAISPSSSAAPRCGQIPPSARTAPSVRTSTIR